MTITGNSNLIKVSTMDAPTDSVYGASKKNVIAILRGNAGSGSTIGISGEKGIASIVAILGQSQQGQAQASVVTYSDATITFSASATDVGITLLCETKE